MALTFEVQVYKKSRGFTVPKRVRNELGIGGGDSIHLIIRTPSGDDLFNGRKTLMSGPEIYGKDISSALTPGSTIVVEASQPLSAYQLPSEQAAVELTEGGRSWVLVNRFERNKKARAECVKSFGTACYVCGFDFEERYGNIGKGFIHVHHLTPVSQVGKGYKIDPNKDLRPVCPNCHEMLHSRSKPPFSIEELQAIVETNRVSRK